MIDDYCYVNIWVQNLINFLQNKFLFQRVLIPKSFRVFLVNLKATPSSSGLEVFKIPPNFITSPNSPSCPSSSSDKCNYSTQNVRNNKVLIVYVRALTVRPNVRAYDGNKCVSSDFIFSSLSSSDKIIR